MKRRKFSEIIIWYILWAVLVIFLFTSVISYANFSVKQVQEQYKIRVETIGQSAADKIKIHIDNSIQSIGIYASLFAHYEDIHSDEAMDALRELSSQTDFSRIWLVKPDGNMISNEGVTSYANGRDYYEGGLAGKTGISGMQTSRAYNEKNVMLYAPIMKDDKVHGIFVGTYNMDVLSGIVNVSYFDGKGYLQLFDSTGEILIESVHEDALAKGENLLTHWSYRTLRDGKTLKEIGQDLVDRKDSVITFKEDSYNEYGYYCPIGVNDWFILVSMPRNLIVDDFTVSISRAVILCLNFIVSVILILITHFYFKNRTLRKLAETDALTGIMNRGTIEREIRKAIEEESQKQHILVLFDVDKFKSVNDTLGHMAGDRLLRDVAEILKEQFDKEVKIGRLGGDEFVIFAKNTEDVAALTKQLSKVAKKVQKIGGKEFASLKVSLSIGMAVYSKDAKDFDELYKVADERMYKVKKAGGNGIRCE